MRKQGNRDLAAYHRVRECGGDSLAGKLVVSGQETAGLDGKTPMREDPIYVVCAVYHAHCADVTMVPVCIP
eukprot:1551137-Amphidinium_carterae.1